MCPVKSYRGVQARSQPCNAGLRIAKSLVLQSISVLALAARSELHKFNALLLPAFGYCFFQPGQPGLFLLCAHYPMYNHSFI